MGNDFRHGQLEWSPNNYLCVGVKDGEGKTRSEEEGEREREREREREW